VEPVAEGSGQSNPGARPGTLVPTVNRDQDDRVLLETRLLAGLIVPFLLAAFVILYFFPDRTKELFAWGISPPMTSFSLASAYIGGAYFFIRVIGAKRWHQVTIGFPPVVAFAILMGIATALHWDRFTSGHISFVTWTTLYATTPFLVLAVWLRNRPVDPRQPDSLEVTLAGPVRVGFAAIGSITLAVALLLFIQPAVMIGVWPWQLTPLTARVLGGIFALPSIADIGTALDPRWSAARITLQSQLVSLAFLIVATIRAWPLFNPGNPATWVFVLGLGSLFVVLIVVHLWTDRRSPAPARLTHSNA